MTPLAVTNIFKSLDSEWDLVCADPASAELVQQWLIEAGVLAEDEERQSLDGLLSFVEQEGRARGRVFNDRWLGALLGLAAGRGERAQLAARFVVQAMLPGAASLTRRLLRTGRDVDEVAQTVITCLYQVVRSYPLSRVNKVAANVVMETLHLASRELSAADGTEYAELSVDVAADEAEPVLAVWPRLLAEQAAARELVASGEEELAGARGELVELLLWGVDSGAVSLRRARAIAEDIRDGARQEAERRGVSAVAWRQRRSAAVRQLRAVAEQWAVAA